MQIITHNLNADNTQRQLKIADGNKRKTAEKLSSGYRINRSADDAAGLTISEKMRKQIRGLTKASKNIQDGISLIQTADGALNEMHDILQRMNELSTQAANDPNTKADRNAIHAELNQLKSEINRISRTTQFNTHTILMAKQLIQIDAEDYGEVIMDDKFYGMGNRAPYQHVYGKSIDFSQINASNKEELINKQFYVTCSQNCRQEFTFRFTDQQTSSISIYGENLSVEIGMKDASLNTGADIVARIHSLVLGKQAEFINALKVTRPNWTNTYNDTIIGHANGVAIDGSKITFYSTMFGPPYFPEMGLIRATDMLQTEQNFLIQVNDNPYQEIALNLRTINSATLGVGVINVSSFEAAGKTMANINHAIANLSDYRAYLGAMQNRLEHAMSIADNSAENTQSAESKLRDSDMAKEMVHFSKSKILEQFGQAMLAQNNQDSDGILQLLNV